MFLGSIVKEDKKDDMSNYCRIKRPIIEGVDDQVEGKREADDDHNQPAEPRDRSPDHMMVKIVRMVYKVSLGKTFWTRDDIDRGLLNWREIPQLLVLPSFKISRK